MVFFPALILFSSFLFGQITIIHSGVLIDGKSEKPLLVYSILIEDDRIIDVVEGYVDPGEGDVAIDLNSFTVLPGFLDHPVAGLVHLNHLCQFLIHAKLFEMILEKSFQLPLLLQQISFV